MAEDAGHDGAGLNPGVLRVVLTGSECTGKTTLAAELAARYRTVWVREYAREHLARKRAPLDASDVEAIARGQIAAEEAALPRARRLLVLDTDLVSTVVYSLHYYGSCPGWIERAARERLAQLYLLHHPDVPWTPDGLQRDRPGKRGEMHGLFRSTLEALGAPVVSIAGPWPERSARAIRAVDDLLAV